MWEISACCWFYYKKIPYCFIYVRTREILSRQLLGRLLACPLASKTGLFPPSPFPVWGYRLPVGCSRGKVKGKGVAWVFLLGFDFCITDSFSWIQLYLYWDLSGRARSRKLLLLLFLRAELRRRSKAWSAGKIWFQTILFFFFKLESGHTWLWTLTSA